MRPPLGLLRSPITSLGDPGKRASTASIAVTTKSIVSSVAQDSLGWRSFQNGPGGNGTGFSSNPASGVPIDSGPSAFGSRSAVTSSSALSIAGSTSATSSSDGRSAGTRASTGWSAPESAPGPARSRASATSSTGPGLWLDCVILWRPASGLRHTGEPARPNLGYFARDPRAPGRKSATRTRAAAAPAPAPAARRDLGSCGSSHRARASRPSGAAG